MVIANGGIPRKNIARRELGAVWSGTWLSLPMSVDGTNRLYQFMSSYSFGAEIVPVCLRFALTPCETGGYNNGR